MLGMAIESGLPLVACDTTDTVNILEILTYLADSDVKPVESNSLAHIDNERGKRQLSVIHANVMYIIDPDLDEIVWELVYKWMAKNNKTLVIVNPDYVSDVMFNAGTVRLPKTMLRRFLRDVMGRNDVDELLDCCGGLTLKDTGEVCSLARVSSGKLTPQTINTMRCRYVANNPGISQVNTHLDFYFENDQLQDWMNVDGRIFLTKLPSRLRPRGLLLNGDPGVGKSLGAKWVARELNLPLYRLDLGSMMSKWAGDSEKNLNATLTIIEQSSPSVVLLDEIEKLFRTGDDTGITSRMLSQLLWWLQEHKKKILTIMTTNDMSIIPRELIRPGRIDKTIEFKPLSGGDIVDFAQELVNSFGKKYDINIDKLFSNYKCKLTQAQITHRVYDQIKQELANKQ